MLTPRRGEGEGRCLDIWLGHPCPTPVLPKHKAFSLGDLDFGLGSCETLTEARPSGYKRGVGAATRSHLRAFEQAASTARATYPPRAPSP